MWIFPAQKEHNQAHSLKTLAPIGNVTTPKNPLTNPDLPDCLNIETNRKSLRASAPAIFPSKSATSPDLNSKTHQKTQRSHHQKDQKQQDHETL
jgi:hypothetical protein